ncbi:hypothetical protein Tco_0405634 [Tanacetum coccineum]
MDIFTKGALWDYWKMGGDEIEKSDNESSDLEECWSDKEETTEIFKIETDVFNYETPLCLAFNEFNYLLKVDPDLLTKYIMGFKTYADYKDGWIYEWNKNVPWVYDKSWLDNGIWREPTPFQLVKTISRHYLPTRNVKFQLVKTISRHYLPTRNVKALDLPSFVRDVCRLTLTVLRLACWSKSALQGLRLIEVISTITWYGPLLYFRALFFSKGFMDTVKHTHVAVSVLWKSLSSVLINHELRLGFEVRVAALLADIMAADERSRAAIVGGGGGVVVDWLLDSIALNKGVGSYGTQAESVSALAYLIADCNVAEAVLKRPKAVPNFLRFIFSAHPHPWEQVLLLELILCRIMLVAIMDIVTFEWDNVDKVSLKPMLSRKAAMRDIAAALEVFEEGGMYLDEPRGNGLGINFVGLTRSNGSMELEKPHVKCTNKTRRILFNKITENSPTVIPGLWDDLDSQHVTVPFAAWALANRVMAISIISVSSDLSEDSVGTPVG